MNNLLYKIYDSDQFNQITKGIKVAQCMQTSFESEPVCNEPLNEIELVVSDSLCCSYCNTEFEDKVEQRLHYKLDWHRYNLKRHLNGLRPISEDDFNKLVGKSDMSSLSGSEIESDNEDDTGTSEAGASNDQAKNEPTSRNTLSNKSRKTLERRSKTIESDSDIEWNEQTCKISKEEKLQACASRHIKMFFENDDGNIFSIYRCLLHHKKDIPQKDSEIITQALHIGKKTKWTIIMIGGGHFAAAVFQDGQPIVHKTFHLYTVRAKQGSAQNSRMSSGKSTTKSAGANLRKHNENLLIHQVQEILDSWSMHIDSSSVILFRAVGRYNRTVLFGGKNPPLDKTDLRLRPLPFPTRRATYKEITRVYEVVSTMEVYGSAKDFTDCFPNSSRAVRRKASKLESMNKIPEGTVGTEEDFLDNNDKIKSLVQPTSQHRNSRSHIDRAKPRKSPNRPLPDIVLRLAQSSSGSEDCLKYNSTDTLIEENCETNFIENLLAFQTVMPMHTKKKASRQKKKPNKEATVINEVLLNAKTKLWNACKLGDNDLLSSVIDDLLATIKKEEQTKQDDAAASNASSASNTVPVNIEDLTKLVNDADEDGNTLLHLAALGGYQDQVWLLLDIGSDPCNKNKKLQTPYVVACNKKVKNIFRRFMEAHPDKFNYQKSQIPGPLTDEIEETEAEKKRQQRKMKRLKEKVRRKEFELKKQEENEKQRFLSLHDKEKRALLGIRMLQAGYTVMSRCFQCAIDMNDLVAFEYDGNQFCSMPCLKEHRLHKKTVI